MQENYFELIKSSYLKTSNESFRFGSIEDGGYSFSPKHIKQASILFSGGISSNVEFEYDLFRFNKNLKLVLVDPTVSRGKLLFKAIARFFLGKPNKLKYLLNTLTFIFILQSNRAWHSKTWLSNKNGIIETLNNKIKLSIKDIVLLKLDIEGSEYELLDEIKKNINLFNCMVFEFHELDKRSQDLYDFITFCSTDFNLTSFEANPSGGFTKNKQPKVIEITLERKN